MKELRLFIAVRPPDEALAQVRQARDALRERLGDETVRWVRDENLHVTLEFLGPTDPAAVDDLEGVMEQAASGSGGPIGLELSAPGAFPNVRRPRTLWIGVTDRDRDLERLERALHDGLAELGYELDEKPFRPHITVGYVRKRARSTDRRTIGTVVGETEAPHDSFRVTELLLVESVLGAGGSRYSDLRTVRLNP